MKTISRYIMTLALLLTAVTGAWAETTVTWDTETWASWTDNTVKTHTVDGVTITAGGNATALKSSSGDYLYIYVNSTSTNTLTFSADAPFNRIEFTKKTPSSTLSVSPLDGWSLSDDQTTVIWEGEATKSLVCETCTLSVTKIKFYLEDAPVTVAWTASTKTGTFTMPGSDVVLTPIYAKAAAFATTGTGSEAKTLLPAAAEGVIAGTDAPLIAEGTGIVANIGETTTAQGTLMYAIGNSATEAPDAFSATVPTAENVADDGADVYVWYYIQGADAPQGEAATLDNTFDNTEPACLTVQVLTNKFDITLNAANANTIEAGKATVTVDGTDKTTAVTEGKLQGVKMGSEVKLEAKPGYKFRKVEVKKKAEAPAILLDNTMTAWTAGKYAVPAGGLTYSAAITVSGDVTLVLTDGETLTLNKGISLASGATLTIQGTGTMAVNGTNNSTASTVAGSGTLVLTSGTLNAKGGNGQSLSTMEDHQTGASGGVAINGNVTINGGTVTATGGNGGNLNVTLSGGVDFTNAGNGGAAISGNATVNAGGWTATNGTNGSYTGYTSGYGCSAGTGGKAVAGTVTDNRN